MKGALGKIFVSCGGTIGAACAVGIPLSKASIPSETKTVITDTVSTVEKCESLNPSEALDIKNSPLSFEQLGERIEGKLNKKCKESYLPGKEDLKRILQTTITDRSKFEFQIVGEDGRDCENIYPCGYLELVDTKYNKKFGFKIRIMKEENQWQIIVVKSIWRKDPSWYDGFPDLKEVNNPIGRDIGVEKGEDFSSLEEIEQRGWSAIKGFSIKRSI